MLVSFDSRLYELAVTEQKQRLEGSSIYLQVDVITSRVSGVVRDVDGEPISGVSVHLPDFKVSDTTDDNGHFELTAEAEEDSTVEITAQKPGFGFVREHVRLGDRSIRLQLKRETP